MDIHQEAARDQKDYTQAMLKDKFADLERIEKRWGVWGLPPELVSRVLSLVAGGMTENAAIDEVTS